jgi:hypothetical protein
MIEDKLFEDCCALADKYETNLLCVLERYTDIEMDYKRQMTNVPYEVLIQDTEKYFKNKLSSL